MPRFARRKCVMIGEAVRSHYGTKLGELSEERFGSGNCGNRRQICAAQRVQWKRLTGGCAAKFSWSEMHYCDRNVRSSGCDCTACGFHRSLVRVFPRDDDEAGTSRGLERLAPWACREESRGTGPRICIHKQDVHVTSGAAMLKRVVKDHDVCSPRDRLSDSTRPIRRHNHGDICVQPLMDEHLVSAITS